MICLLKHQAFREGLWHSSECPFISQSFHFEPKLVVSLFQIVYAIQSFISCQDGNLYKDRYLNTPKFWWENASVSVYWFRESLSVFGFSQNDTGLSEQTDMDTFSAFITPVAPESNAFTAWDLSLLNSLKDKRQVQTLSPPLFSLSLSLSCEPMKSLSRRSLLLNGSRQKVWVRVH